MLPTNLNEISHLVVQSVGVSLLWEDELLPLEHEGVGTDLESGGLGPALAIAHAHQAVVELLQRRRRECTTTTIRKAPASP